MKGRIPLKKNFRGIDFNPMRSGVLLIILINLLLGCGAPGDPILDNMYTRNIYPGASSTYSIGSEDLPYSEGWFDNLYVLDDVEIEGYTTFGNQIILEGDGKAWLEFRPDTDFESVRAHGAPTWVLRGIFGGFSLPIFAPNEELHCDICVPSRWDAESDIEIHFDLWLDTAQDAANDSFRLGLNWENRDPNAGIVPNAPVTIEVEIVTGVCPQYQCFQVPFQIDHDGGTRTIEGDDNLALRLRRIDVVDGNEIEGEVVIDHIGIIFRCDKLGASTL